MAKVIDIQTVIEEIQSLLDISSYSHHDMGFDGLKHVLDLIEKAPTLTPLNEWVSVEERLPEGHAQVLMWSAKWNIAEAGSYYNKHFWVYSEIGDGYIAEDITYWMPLPSSPDRHPLEGEENT